MVRSCGTHHGVKFWMNIEPCGLFCGSMTWWLLIYGMYATTFGVIIPWMGWSILGVLNIIAFNSISIIAIYSHIQAMCTDPGSVPKDARPLISDIEERDYEANETTRDRYRKFCRRCNAFKPQRAHHCSICGRCIVKMDHHCPWVNNCIGVGNHKLFILFIFWVFVDCLYSLILTVSRYLICLFKSDCGDMEMQLVVIMLVVESALFGLFTLCMMGDQMTTVMTNQTQIDRLKNKRYEYQTEVNEVFGTPVAVRFKWDWLTPTETIFPSHVRDIIYGFRLEESEETESNPLIPPEEIISPGSSVERRDSDPNLKGLRPRRMKATGESASEDSNYTHEDGVAGMEWANEPAMVELKDEGGGVEIEMMINQSSNSISGPGLNNARKRS